MLPREKRHETADGNIFYAHLDEPTYALMPKIEESSALLHAGKRASGYQAKPLFNPSLRRAKLGDGHGALVA